ncbi:MAG: hypothetical protein AB9835_02975 [Eubacteriales bacterium]
MTIYIMLQGSINEIINNTSIHVLLRLITAGAFQFGLAGLGIVIVLIVRKESVVSYGLRLRGIIPSILFCVLCFVPYIVFAVAGGLVQSYLPFQSVWTTKEVLGSPFPVNALGMLITATAWGFFEGFNYVVISDKINLLLPSTKPWLNWGAMICAVMCLLIHGMIGVTAENIIEALTVVIIIYGMLTVRKITGNAWGCVFIFIFLWNAF